MNHTEQDMSAAGRAQERPGKAPASHPSPARLMNVVAVLERRPRNIGLWLGATAIDLLLEVAVPKADTDWDVVVDGRPVELTAPLTADSFAYILPKDRPVPKPQPWEALKGAFADDPEFREIVDAGRRIREAERPRP